MKLRHSVAVLGCWAMVTGCDSVKPGAASRPGETRPRAVGGGTGRPLAIVAGQSIQSADLQPYLAEAAGAAVLEEIVLDAALGKELGVPLSTIERTEVERERNASLALIRGETGFTESQALEQLEQSRIDRGLGPARFDALLRRNAAMRRLVAAEVTVTADELRLSRDVNFGDRVRARLIVLRSAREAEQLRMRLSGGGDIAAEFAAVARSRSIDPSAADGGLLESVSWQDPAVPLPLQQALRDTPPGSITPVVALDGASAIAFVEQRLGAADSGISNAELESRIRLRKERVAMDALANRLLAGSRVTVFDESLRWAWETRGK